MCENKESTEFPNFKLLLQQPENYILKNGISLKLLPNPNLELLGFTIRLKAGSLYQLKKLAASSLVQILSEGTHYRSAVEVAQQIDYFGAHTEFVNGKDFVSLTFYVARRNFQALLPLIFEILTEPLCAESELMRYKETITQQLAYNQEKISYLAKMKFAASLYPNHPYGNVLNFEDIQALSVSDLHTHHQLYNKNNMRLFLFGSYTAEDIATLDAVFSDMPSGKVAEHQFPLQNLETIKQSVEIHKEGALQTAIRIGSKIPNITHVDYFNLMIYNTLLGGYFGSRLMQNIREDKGWSYAIYSALINLQESAYFYIDTEVKAGVEDEVIREIEKEMQRIREEKISDKEIYKLRQYLIGDLLRQIDGTYSLYKQLIYYDDYHLSLNRIEQIYKYLNRFNADDIMNIARQYLNLAAITVIVKP